MAYNLKNRNFLKLLDFTPKEIQYLLDLAAERRTQEGQVCRHRTAPPEGQEHRPHL